MIEKIELTNFKKFKSETIALKPHGLSLLAGGNNSGKSTLLQALAVWDFCITVLKNEKGEAALTPAHTGQGVGLSDDEFSPIQMPSLSHLWTNLTNQVKGADGYTLSIKPTWQDAAGVERFLQISLALANDRLFIKQTSSNIEAGEETPHIAFVPPFAGITAKEQRMSVAQRRSLTGSGLVGGTIRNLLFELESENQRQRETLKDENGRIKTSQLKKLRETDPWELLQSAMGRFFQTSLSVSPFNDLYQSYIRVSLVKGNWEGTRIKKFPKFKPRDLMSEGSGFLQWLSVFSLALDPETDVLLLDEPDAHLHSSLQTLLLSELESIAARLEKQILLATHSTEILRWADHSKILSFRGGKVKYLGDDAARMGLFAGLGSEFSPRLDRLKKSKALLLVENESDARFLKIMAAKIGKTIPDDVVVWAWTGSSKERKQLFLQLKGDIPELKAVSIRDRDSLEQKNVDESTLRDKSEKNAEPNLKLRVWQRRHIENYLLCPDAIARAAGKTTQEVRDFFADHHAIAIPNNFTEQNVVQAIKDAHGKFLMETSENSVEKQFKVSKIDVAKALTAGEICADVKVVIDDILAM
ncbi:ATP-dependent endonuclease [Salipiger sp. PrR007]|uniref:ATP-dependent nuclease n=1 Tax=Salipiger sp. PrR007 TaxID=2706884 RepID=UPI0013BD2F9A|nr:AAA family ATPase [Salipiger sp. PrR007]NDW34935.1 AAA family ATPase [Salipiger sp. PrR007]